MISQVVIDKVFDAAAIEEVVGEYVTLKKAGANFKGLCPFHDDKNPSMSVSPSKGIYKCFSCGKGGNSFQFIMEHEGLSYPLAIKFLADKYNIEIATEQLDIGQLEEEARKKDGIYGCLEFAKNHFNSQLNQSQEGTVIYKPYLTERGIGQQSVDQFSIGLSGLHKSDFLQAGLKNGYTVQQMSDAGLVKKIEENGSLVEANLRDTFIERIVFPIYNISGKVLGFGGRIIKKNTKAPKYLNSPETLVYEKRKELFGMHLAKNAIRKTDMVYVVEGYMDVVSLFQNGVENVVAVSGTAFTPEQARLIKRFTPNVTLLFDGDEAGINASMKHISTLLTADINVRIVLFPDGEDPDSYIQNNGHQGFVDFVDATSKNVVEFISAVKMDGKENDPIAKAETARSIAENIAFIPDPLKRSAYIGEAANLLEIGVRILNEETNKYRIKSQQQGQSRSSYDPPLPILDEPKIPEALVEDKTNYQELELLKSLILYADKMFDEEKTVAQFIFEELEADGVWPTSAEYGEIFKEAYEYFKEHQQLNELYFVKNKNTVKLAADILSQGHTLSEGWETHYEKFVKTEVDNFQNQIAENLNYLKKSHIEKLMQENQEKLKDAETDEDILIFQNIHLQLQNLLLKITEQSGTVILK
jgi:DNA primase